MSWQVGSACYGSLTAANQAAASTQVGAVVSHGGSVYVTSLAAADASGVTYSFSPLSGGAPVSMTVALNPPACGLMGVEDGVQLGALVSLVLVSTWAVVFVARAIREVERGSDNA